MRAGTPPGAIPYGPAGAVAAAADRTSLLRTIEALERQRDTLGAPTIDLALAPLRSRLAALEAGAGLAGLAARSSERKVVTVLFVDIAGYTEMSERLGSEAMLEIVNGLFDRLVPVIERYGGTIDKFIGDEIMAVFGAPRAAEHHAEHALRAALEIFTTLAAYNRERGLELGLHIGANTGPVIAGAVGSRARRDYSVTGDTVNVAARLEGAAEAGQILVGPSTFRHTVQLFEFEPLEPLAVKGKMRPLDVYRLMSETPRRARHYAGGLQLVFSGRRDEMRLLLERAASDTPEDRGVVGIVAEPGVGKSRLLAEFHDRLGSEVRWLEASAHEYRSEVSYAVVHEMLDGLVGLADDADPEQAAAAYADFLEGMGGGRATDVRAYLFRLRGLPLDAASETMLSELTSEALRQRMVGAAAELLSAATAGRSGVVCLEDLHWADPSSMSLLRALAESSALAHVLFVFTTRTDMGMATQWIADLRACRDRPSLIELGPLSDVETRALITDALGAEGWSELRSDVLAKSQGNPLYLVSFLRSLVDEGVAVLSRGRVTVTGSVTAVTIPETLQAVVGSRIDRLPDVARQLLQWASVLGAVFWPRHAARISHAESGSPQIDETLALLCERQLLQGESDGRLRFVHAVVRDVAYGQMLERDRRRLHSVTARCLEEEISPTSEADVALLAWHCEHAGDRSLASARYETAAALAAKTYANREQLRYLESAIRLAGADDVVRIAALTERAGDVLHLLGRFGEAADLFESILALASPIDALDAARLHRKIAKTLTPRWQHDPANRALDEARRLLDGSPVISSAPWWREHFALELFRMWSHYMQGRLADIVETIARLAPEVDAHGTLGERGLFHRNLALLRLRQQRYRPDPATVELAAQAADELREAGDIAEICLATFTHAFTELWSGAIQDADRHLQDVLSETVRLGDAERNLLCLVYLAVSARLRGDIVTAEAFAEAAMAVARANGAPHYEGVSHANLGWVAWRRGDRALADDHLMSARRLCLANYPFIWMHAVVSLARAMEGMAMSAATEHARSMIGPTLQLLRPTVQDALELAAGSPSPHTLQAVVDAARRTGYL
jgi:class 3 adenylate cyclase/tetratricopeptide (TPR) repeat protein